MFIRYYFCDPKDQLRLEEEIWKEKYETNMVALINGFAHGLKPLEAQIQAVCLREGLLVELGFLFCIWAEKIQVVLAIIPDIGLAKTEEEEPWPFFLLNGKTLGNEHHNLFFPFNLPKDEKTNYDPTKEGFRMVLAVNRLVADLGRSGLPKEIRQNIALVTKAMNLVGVGGQGYCGPGKWQKID